MGTLPRSAGLAAKLGSLSELTSPSLTQTSTWIPTAYLKSYRSIFNLKQRPGRPSFVSLFAQPAVLLTWDAVQAHGPVIKLMASKKLVGLVGWDEVCPLFSLHRLKA